MANQTKKEDNDAIGEVTSTYIMELHLLGGIREPINVPTKDLREILRLCPELSQVFDQTICFRTHEVPTITYEWRGETVFGVAAKPMTP